MSFKTGDITRGGQLALLRFRMFMQINNVLFYYVVIGWLLIVSCVIYLRLNTEVFYNGVHFWWAQSLIPFTEIMKSPPTFELWYKGKTYIFTWEQMLTDPYAVWCGLKLRDEVVTCLLVSSVLVAAFYGVVFFVLARIGRGQSGDEIIAGRTFEPVKTVARMLRQRGEASDMVIDKLPLKKDAEIQNFAMHGTVGTGKSTLIRKKLLHLKRKGAPVILYDKGCTFVEEFYDPERGDILLNPHDKRCPHWDMWGECQNLPDFESMTETLIPMGNTADPFWQGSARTIFAEGAERMRNDKDRSYNKFLRTLLSVGLDKLRAYLDGTPAATLVDGSIEKTAISIRSVLTNYVKSMRYLQGTDDPDKPRFTIREWMKENADKARPAWLFITSNERYHESLKPLISMWLGIASTNLLSLEPSRRRRIWFVYDEIPSLHKLPSLPRVLAEGRKFGGCFVLGFQSFAQMEEAYGHDFAKAIYDLLNTKYFFRSPSAEVAKHVATDLGEVVRKRFSEQTSFGSEQVRDGISYGKDEERVLIKSYSDVQKLNDLECFVTLPGDYPITKLKLKFTRLPVVAEALIERDIITALDPQIEMSLVSIESEERKAVQGLFESDPKPAQESPLREKAAAVFSDKAEATASQGLPDEQKQKRPRKTRQKKTHLVAVEGLKDGEQLDTRTGEIVKVAPASGVDLDIGEVGNVKPRTSAGVDEAAALQRNNPPPTDEDDDSTDAAVVAGGGRQNEIPITQAPVTLSPENERNVADDYGDYEQYLSETRQRIELEERNFIPTHGNEPEM